MKRRHLLLVALSLIISICMCFALAACDSCDEDKGTPTALATPVVTIDDSGVASWKAVENATAYAYKVDDGTEVETTELSRQLSDGQKISVKAVGDGTNYSDSAWSAVSTYTASSKPATPVTLGTPAVSVDGNGLASWSTVANASKYAYKINDGEETLITETSVQLTDGQSIVVKAVGDGTNYSDSAWSTAKTYTAGSQPATPVTLGTPAVSIDGNGLASWSTVANASKYAYKINDGEETLTTEKSVQLTDGQSIVVKAVGDGTNYSDSAWSTAETYTAGSQPVDPVMTHAEYMSAEVDATVKVSGVVTGIAGKNVFFQDNDGGYFIYNSDLPEDIAVGKTITAEGTIAVYNGLREITTATVTVSDAALATVVATDITEVFTSATEMNDDALLALQGMLVTIKGVTLETPNGSYYYFSINDNQSMVYVYGTQCIDATAQDELKALLTANVGRTADVTGFVSVFKNFQIVPAGENTVKVYLDTPEIDVDDNGLASWDAVANASKYAYQINDGETAYVEITDDLSVQLHDGDTIVLWAVGDGTTYADGDTATATYTQIALAAPEISTTKTGAHWSAVAHADGYKCYITHSDGTSEIKELSEDETTIVLADNDVIYVVAVGAGIYKDSEPSNEVTYKAPTEPTQLDAPEVSIKRDGTVTWSHAAAISFVYEINGKEVSVDKDTLSVKLNDGDKFAVKAIADKTNAMFLDSDFSKELTYKAPAKYGEPTNVIFTDDTANEGNVLISWTAPENAGDDTKYIVKIDDEEEYIADGEEISIAIKAYSEIKIMTAEEGSDDDLADYGDYSAFIDGSDFVDVTDEYLAYFNGYKVAAEKEAVEDFDIPAMVFEEVEIEVALNGATYSDVEIDWSIKVKGSDDEPEYAILEENLLWIDPSDAPADGETIIVTATISCGTASDTVEFEIFVKLVQTTTEEIKVSDLGYAHGTVIPSIAGDLIEITLSKGSGSSSPTYYSSNDPKGIRTYAKNTVMVSADGQTITKIVFTCSNLGIAVETNVGDCDISGTKIIWTGLTNEYVQFTMGTTTGTTNTITDIEVTYETPNFTDEDKVDKAIADLPELEETYISDFTVPVVGKFKLAISWSTTVVSGDGNISIDNDGNATVTRGATSNTTVTVTASITCGEITKTKDYTVTVDKAPAADEIVTLATCDFTDKAHYNKISSYTTEWTASFDDLAWKINGFNNNNQGWDLIKGGNNKAETNAYISVSIPGAVTKIFVTITAITTSQINAANLVIKDSNGGVVATISVFDSLSTDGLEIDTSEYQGNNYTYSLEFSFAKTSSNGTAISISKLVYSGYTYTA